MKESEKENMKLIAKLASQLNDKEKSALVRFANDLIFIKKVSEESE